MTIAVKEKEPIIVSRAALRRAGFRTGQKLEVKASGGLITIVPKSPTPDHEYSADQRRAIDARLKRAMDEVKKGHTAGPFDTAEEMIASLKRELQKSAARRTKPRPR